MKNFVAEWMHFHFGENQKRSVFLQLMFVLLGLLLLCGLLLLYQDTPLAIPFWGGLFLCLFLFPGRWWRKTVRPVLRDWWGMGKRETLVFFAVVLASTLVFSILAHGFLFTNEFYSHDSISNLSRIDGRFRYYTTLGRSLLLLYETLRGTVAVPWVVGILFTLWAGLASVVILRLLDIRSIPARIIASGLVCTSISFAATGATYIYCMDEYALALLLAALGCWLIRQRCDILGVFLIILSLALYQAYFSTALVFCLLLVIRSVLESQTPRRILLEGVRYLFLLAFGFFLYSAAWSAACGLLGIEKARTAQTLLALPLSKLFPLLQGAYKNYAHTLPNGTGVLGQLYPTVVLLLFLSLVVWLVGWCRSQTLPWANKALLLLAAFLSPMAFNASYILFLRNTSELISFAVGLLFPCFLFCREHAANEFHPRLTLRLRAAIPVLLCLVIWQNVVFSNQAYIKKDMEKSASIAVVTRLIERIEQLDGYVPGETPVLLWGYINSNAYFEQRVRPRFEEISGVVGLGYTLSPSYCMGAYIQEYLNYPFVQASIDDLTPEQQKEAAAMPPFPHQGGVQMIGGCAVARLN